MKSINKIMILTRSTKLCKNLLHYGLGLAKENNAEVLVVHSIYDPMELGNIMYIPVPTKTVLAEEFAKIQQKAKAELDDIINSEIEKGMKVETIVSETESAKEIIELVENNTIDLLLLRAHKESYLEHALFGHSNETLIRKMPCSILLYKDESY